MSFENIECDNCPGYRKCKNKQCDHCVAEREQEMQASNVENAFVALPYYYQDVTTVAEPAAVDNETHLLRFVEANGTIYTKVQDTIVRLSNKAIGGSEYEVVVDGTSVAKGALKNALISKDNNRNETARKLASQRAPSDAECLWISNLNVPIADDVLHVQLSTNSEDQLEYDMEFPYVGLEANASNVPKKLLQYAQRQIKAKGYNPRSHTAYKCQNVRMIVDTETHTLKDLEFDLRYPQQPPVEKQVFSCDPQDLDQVTGLTMALEEHIAMNSFEALNKTQRATELLHVISEHRVKLEESLISSELSNSGTAARSHYSIEPRINAAVQEATDMLWEAVGLTLNPGVRYHQRKMEQENKPGRDFGIQYAKRVTKETLDKYQDVLESKNFVKKAMLKRRLKNIRDAIQRMINSGSMYKTSYEGLKTWIEMALNSNEFKQDLINLDE